MNGPCTARCYEAHSRSSASLVRCRTSWSYDTRWILGARQDDVLARSDPATAGKVTRGVALLATNRTSLLRNGLTQGIETPADTADNLPPAGFHRAGTSTFYGAYVRC